MPVFAVSWYNDAKTILHFDIQENWDWNDAYEFLKTQGEWLETVEHGVHTIIDFHNVRTVPKRSGMVHLRKIMNTRYPNEELAVFVGTHFLLQTIINSVGKLYGMSTLIQDYRFVSTTDEALAAIAEYERKKDVQKNG